MAQADKRPIEPRAASARSQLLPDLAALRIREYRLLWSGTLAMSALMPLQFTTGLLYLQSAAPDDKKLLLAGLLSAVRGGVMLLIGLPGGALADRFDRRQLLIAAQGVAFSANTAVAAVMLSGDGARALWLFFALTFVAAGAMAVDLPARQALVAQLVPRERLANAVALDQVAMQLAFPVSLSLTGLLIEHLGFGRTYACSLAGHVLALMALARLRPPPRLAGSGASVALIANMREGLAYVRRTPTVFWLLLLLFGVMSIGFPPVGSLGPVWVTRVLGLSPAQFGFFAAMWGLGAMLASITMTTLAQTQRRGRLVATGAIGFAVCVVVWGYSRSVPVSALMNFCLGALLSTTQIAARSLVQGMVPGAIQGRVMSLFMLNMGLSQFMSAPVGALAQAITFERLTPILGWLCLVLTAGIVFTRPDLRRAGEERPVQPVPARRH